MANAATWRAANEQARSEEEAQRASTDGVQLQGRMSGRARSQPPYPEAQRALTDGTQPQGQLSSRLRTQGSRTTTHSLGRSGVNERGARRRPDALKLDVLRSPVGIYSPTTPGLRYQSPVTIAALKLQRRWRDVQACKSAKAQLARLRAEFKAAQLRKPKVSPRSKLRRVKAGLSRTKAALRIQSAWRASRARRRQLTGGLCRTKTVQLTALLAEHLWQQVGIIRHSDAVRYADRLVQAGYDTPEKFDRTDIQDLVSRFGFKPGLGADIARYRDRKAHEALRHRKAEEITSAIRQANRNRSIFFDRAWVALVNVANGLRGVRRPGWLLILWRIGVTVLVVHALLVTRQLRLRAK